MTRIFKMSLFMPPISPLRDKATGKTVKNATKAVRWAMDYVHCMYDADSPSPAKGVETSGKDPVRACFLCHDPKARCRIMNFEL